MTFLTRDLILNHDDIKYEVVDVPEWGGSVMIKTMTGTERDAFEASLVELKQGGRNIKIDNIRAKLVAKTVVDPDTKQLLFSVADIETLGRKSAAALDRTFSVSQRLSKITESDIEELEKN